MENRRHKTLAPLKVRQGDLLLCPLVDVAIKDDRASMGVPIFGLQAGSDRTVHTYERNGVIVRVEPSVHGRATILDKDIWIYALSHYVRALDEGRIAPRAPVRFTSYGFLKSTERGLSGRSYAGMAKALARLRGTVVYTNVITGDGHRAEKSWGLLADHEIVERDKRGRAYGVQIELPTWVHEAIEARDVLTLHDDYFRISRPLDRRLYELARRHVGRQRQWECRLELLREKAACTAPLKRLRHTIRTRLTRDGLPGFLVEHDAERDVVIFRRTGP